MTTNKGFDKKVLGEMNTSFEQIIADVRNKFSMLQNSPKYKIDELPKIMPSAGIYIFSETNLPLYVGRTNNLRKRLQYHTRNNHNQATFAFLLARHATGNRKASYKQKGSRQDLLLNQTFRGEFDRAREKIRTMNVQFVEVTDPITQTILEVFAAFETKAKYNDFDNH